MTDKREIKIYISGPLSGNKITGNILRAKQIALGIAKMGFTVICPHVDPAWLDSYYQFTYNDYLEMCMAKLKDCHAIVLLEEYKISNGAIREYGCADAWGLDIFFEEEIWKLKEWDWTQNKKYRRDYLYSLFNYALDDLADLMYSPDGRIKHGDRGSWKKPLEENIKHLFNHIKRFDQGEMVDKDSGKATLSCIMARAGICYDQIKGVLNG